MPIFYDAEDADTFAYWHQQVGQDFVPLPPETRTTAVLALESFDDVISFGDVIFYFCRDELVMTAEVLSLAPGIITVTSADSCPQRPYYLVVANVRVILDTLDPGFLVDIDSTSEERDAEVTHYRFARRPIYGVAWAFTNLSVGGDFFDAVDTCFKHRGLHLKHED